MKAITNITAQPRLLWTFLGFFQHPAIRLTHALIICFVLLQFFSSTFMTVWGGGASLIGWLHMWSGMNAFVLMLILTVLSFKRHGLKHFYPYLWGDIEQLKRDVSASLRFKLVPPSDGGLGAVVQGLGLGAIWLTAVSGLLWFLFWQAGSMLAPPLRAAHDWLSWLVILYFIGHGSMALVHFIAWQHARQHAHHAPNHAPGHTPENSQGPAPENPQSQVAETPPGPEHQ